MHGNPLLSFLGCCIPSWHVVSSNSERRSNSLFEKRSGSERKRNWLFEKHSAYSGGFRKAFGECSRRIRCDIKPNEPYELYSERIPGGFAQKYPPLHSSYSEPKYKNTFYKHSETYTFQRDSAIMADLCSPTYGYCERNCMHRPTKYRAVDHRRRKGVHKNVCMEHNFCNVTEWVCVTLNRGP